MPLRGTHELVALLLVLSGCQSAPPEPAPAASDAGPGPSSAAVAQHHGTDSEPANPAMGAPAVLVDAHWKNFPGPTLKPEIGDARKVWGIRPVSDSFDAVTFGLFQVKRVEGGVVVVDGYVPAHVPGAFLQRVTPAKSLKKGAAVMIDTAGSAALGRVVEVSDQVLVKYLWHGRVVQIGVTPERLRALTGKLAYGEPVVYRSGSRFAHGRVAHAGGGKLWIVGDAGKPQQIDATAARPVPVTKLHRKGDEVWAVKMGTLESATISAVLDDGVAYEVLFAGESGKNVLAYDLVTDRP